MPFILFKYRFLYLTIKNQFLSSIQFSSTFDPIESVFPLKEGAFPHFRIVLTSLPQHSIYKSNHEKHNIAHTLDTKKIIFFSIWSVISVADSTEERNVESNRNVTTCTTYDVITYLFRITVVCFGRVRLRDGNSHEYEIG